MDKNYVFLVVLRNNEFFVSWLPWKFNKICANTSSFKINCVFLLKYFLVAISFDNFNGVWIFLISFGFDKCTSYCWHYNHTIFIILKNYFLASDGTLIHFLCSKVRPLVNISRNIIFLICMVVYLCNLTKNLF